MKQKKMVTVSVVLLLITMIFCHVFLWHEASELEDNDGVSGRSNTGDATSGNVSLSTDDGANMAEVFSQKSTLSRVSGGLVPDIQIMQLQELLDDDSNREKTLAKAIILSDGTVAQQLAAIDAFRWLGGRDAIKTLISLRKEAYPEVAEEAGRVLGHLLARGLYAGNLSMSATGRDPDQENIIGDEIGADEVQEIEENDMEKGDEDKAIWDSTETVGFDAAIWEKAIREAPSDLDRDELLILMSAYPGTKSIPVLLNLLESEKPELREHALEYLEFVTYGEIITTRQQGEDWLAVHGAMEDYTP